MGPEVTLVNPAYETALELKQVLSESQLLNDTDEPFQDKYHFYVSDLAEKFTNFASSILPDQIKQTKKINIEDF
jgi:glutamate racemase